MRGLFFATWMGGGNEGGGSRFDNLSQCIGWLLMHAQVGGTWAVTYSGEVIACGDTHTQRGS